MLPTVCEKCMTESHPTCVVKTYLQWLNDTDFDPHCQLCRVALDDGRETIRLTCFDVFHWECLDKYARSFPENTAPAGYNCPVCRTPIVPEKNNASPVARACRGKLETAHWAMAASPDTSPAAPAGLTTPRKAQPALRDARHSASRGRAPAMASSVGAGAVSRKLDSPDTVLDMGDSENDEDKMLGSPNEWFHRMVKDNLGSDRRRKPALKQDSSGTSLKRTVIIIVLIAVVLITAIELLTRARPTTVENDPWLDPMMNPNIRSSD